MTPEKRRRRVIIFSVIGLFLTAGVVFYKVKKHAFLNHQLKNIVKDKTHQIYNLNYDSISVDEVGGNLFIKNIHVQGDTLLQQQMISNQDTNAASAIFDIYVPVIKVVAFKTAKALLSKQLECREIIIQDPVINIYLFPGQGKPADPKKKQEELYKQILGNFKLIKADSVSVINSQVVASDFFNKQVKFHTYNTSINLKEVAIDSTYNQDRTRTLFCKEIGITSNKIVFGEKRNVAEVKNATFNTRSKIVAFSSFSYDAFKSNGFFKTTLEGISLAGIEWRGPVENSDLVIDKAVIQKGELETLTDENKESGPEQKKRQRILTGWIRNFKLNSLQVKSVTYIGKTTQLKKKPVIVRNNSFSINHVSIDRQSAFNGDLINSAREIELHNDAITVKSADNLYKYKVAGIKLNTREKTVTIKSIQVIPQLTETDFAKRARHQKSRYDIQIDGIVCNGVNYEKLINQEVDIDNVKIAHTSIKVFLDLSYPRDTIPINGPQITYPQQVIHQFGIPVKVNGFTSSNTYIEYKEKNAQSHSSGRVRFSNAYLTINNISTHKARAGEKMTASFKANFLEKVPVTGGFTFSLNNWQKGVFTAEANIANPIEATILNELTEPMSLLRIEKGEIRSVHFYMQADTNTSNGTLVLPYEDVKISLLKKDGDHYNKKGIVSLLANVMVKNNNKEGEHMRTAKVLLTRNRYRTFFNFIWMTLFKGIKDIGVLKL